MSALPVVGDEGQLVGILTQGDLMRRMELGAPLRSAEEAARSGDSMVVCPRPQLVRSGRHDTARNRGRRRHTALPDRGDHGAEQVPKGACHPWRKVGRDRQSSRPTARHRRCAGRPCGEGRRFAAAGYRGAARRRSRASGPACWRQRCRRQRGPLRHGRDRCHAAGCARGSRERTGFRVGQCQPLGRAGSARPEPSG